MAVEPFVKKNKQAALQNSTAIAWKKAN